MHIHDVRWRIINMFDSESAVGFSKAPQSLLLNHFEFSYPLSLNPVTFHSEVKGLTIEIDDSSWFLDYSTATLENIQHIVLDAS